MSVQFCGYGVMFVSPCFSKTWGLKPVFICIHYGLVQTTVRHSLITTWGSEQVPSYIHYGLVRDGHCPGQRCGRGIVVSKDMLNADPENGVDKGHLHGLIYFGIYRNSFMLFKNIMLIHLTPHKNYIGFLNLCYKI